MSMELACARTAEGSAESQLRASTKKRTIALRAAVSTPFPATSPTSTATSPPGSPPGSFRAPPRRLAGGRCVEEAAVVAGHLRKRLGHEAQGQGSCDSALALEVE